MVSYDDPFYHEENYDGLTDTQRLDKLKLERASVRNLASKKHRTVVTQLRYANASTADIDSATDVCTRLCEALAQFDEFILELDPNDVQSDDYFAKLKEALTCLTVDAENAHKRDMRILNLSMTRASLTSAASPSPNHQTAAPAPWSSRKSAKNDLPIFDGAPSNYRRWIKMYEELVENNLAYEPTAKFLALVEKIGPVGKDLIGDLDPDLEGIRIAKECLSKHFEDKRRIREDVCVKVRRLKRFSPNMPSSTLRQSVIVLERANKALEAANVGSTYLDGQFYDIIIPKLTDQMAMDYHRAHPDDSQRTAKGLIEFIKTEVEIFIRTNDAIALANESATPISPSVPHARSRPISTVTHRNSPSTNGVIMNCNICRGPHKTIYCNSQGEV